MAVIEQFQLYFWPEEIPGGLLKLIHFAATQPGWFSEGFELACDPDDVMLRSYSEKPEFLDALFTIGQADGTGSTYAIWRQNGPLSDAPIVAFGSEGGAHVVGSNLVDLLRILTLDAEPMISWDEVTYYKSDNAEPCEGAAGYTNWLVKNFNAKPVIDANEATQIVRNAQTVHQAQFQAWLTKFSA